MKKALCALGLSASLAPFGCSSKDQVDIGDDDVASLGNELEDYEGQWSGYAEAYEFKRYSEASGSDRMHITLDQSGNGTVEFGDAEPIPAPTPDDDVYPPEGAVLIEERDGTPPDLIGGFDYPVHRSAVEAKRLRFELQPGDLMVGWCSLQAVALPDGSYYCSGVPSGETSPCYSVDGSESHYVDCDRQEACHRICDCTAGPCDATRTAIVTFDAALSAAGEELNGTLRIDREHVTVRLTKQ